MKVLNTIHTFRKQTTSVKVGSSLLPKRIEYFMTIENIPLNDADITSLFFFLRSFEPIPGHGLLLWDFMITLRHSLGLLWTSDQPDAETSVYLTTQHSRQTAMLPARFEPTFPASERP
jgi:hypothetical protein